MKKILHNPTNEIHVIIKNSLSKRKQNKVKEVQRKIFKINIYPIT